MQRLTDTPVVIPAVHAARIASLLERCAEHEDQRSRGKVAFPRVVMLELATEARQWSRYLTAAIPRPEVEGPAVPPTR